MEDLSIDGMKYADVAEWLRLGEQANIWDQSSDRKSLYVPLVRYAMVLAAEIIEGNVEGVISDCGISKEETA